MNIILIERRLTILKLIMPVLYATIESGTDLVEAAVFPDFYSTTRVKHSSLTCEIRIIIDPDVG